MDPLSLSLFASITLVLVAALSALFVLRVAQRRDRPERRKTQDASPTRSFKAQRRRDLDPEGSEAPTAPESALRIPPADQPRIEAIPTRNQPLRPF